MTIATPWPSVATVTVKVHYKSLQSSVTGCHFPLLDFGFLWFAYVAQCVVCRNVINMFVESPSVRIAALSVWTRRFVFLVF